MICTVSVFSSDDFLNLLPVFHAIGSDPMVDMMVRTRSVNGSVKEMRSRGPEGSLFCLIHFFLMKKITTPAMIATAAIPPMIPPTMRPVSFFLSSPESDGLGSGSGAGVGSGTGVGSGAGGESGVQCAYTVVSASNIVAAEIWVPPDDSVNHPSKE